MAPDAVERFRLAQGRTEGAFRDFSIAERVEAPVAHSVLNRMRILLIAPNYNREIPGESWSTYKWVQGMSARFETTVLTMHKGQWDPTRSPTSATEVVNWPDLSLPKSFSRLNSELKPGYLFFYCRARRWIKSARARGVRFDLIHQINPLALRYPSPARGLGYRYIVGPLAGSLPTPQGFQGAGADRKWYRKLRNLDAWRLRNDPWLKGTYADADLVLGVAPYVNERLRPANVRRFEVMSETGVESVTSESKQEPSADRPLQLLFVGRIIATKGIVEAIRSTALASKSVPVELTIIGAGDLSGYCAEEIHRLGADSFIKMLGRLSRDEVFTWYRHADVFLFPSFREPSGNVVFEALSQGLPVITTTEGGPGYVVRHDCGCLVHPESPEQLVSHLASEIVRIARNPGRVPAMSGAAIARIREIGLWDRKYDRLAELYRTVATGG